MQSNLNTFYDSPAIVKDQSAGPETFDGVNKFATNHQFSVNPCDPSDGTPATEGTVAITGRLLGASVFKPIIDESTGDPLVIDLANPVDYRITGRYAEFGYAPTAVDGDYEFVVCGW